MKVKESYILLQTCQSYEDYVSSVPRFLLVTLFVLNSVRTITLLYELDFLCVSTMLTVPNVKYIYCVLFESPAVIAFITFQVIDKVPYHINFQNCFLFVVWFK